MNEVIKVFYCKKCKSNQNCKTFWLNRKKLCVSYCRFCGKIIPQAKIPKHKNFFYCKQCGSKHIPKIVGQLFCSTRCKSIFHRKRRVLA